MNQGKENLIVNLMFQFALDIIGFTEKLDEKESIIWLTSFFGRVLQSGRM
jgi:hypothetical protein